MNMDILFKNEEEKIATERVLAAFRVKSLNNDIDNWIGEVLKYAKNIDELLNDNGIVPRYLDKVSTINENNIVELDEDLKSLDFRVLEILEDLIKRINTRLELIRTHDETLKAIEQKYDLSNMDLEAEIKLAKLNKENFA